MTSPTPTVAIVGRPNVGKSTLFNRLVGRRQSIVHDQPGVTRDRVVGLGELGTRNEASRVQLIDTGGLLFEDDALGLNAQVFFAVEESDLLLLVVDGKSGPVPGDEEIWADLRRRGKPTILVVNKGDTRVARETFEEFYRLGVPHQVLVSAEHGTGMGDLHDLADELLPERGEDEDVEGESRLALVGRPNVGKSSILNRLLGSDRALVSPQAGTTRDPVDSVLTRGDETYRLVDTAGIRRRSKTSGAPEELAVLMARRQIERAHCALLVIDAAAGVTTGDLAIAGIARDLHRSVVTLINKWDLLDDDGRRRLDDSWPRLAELLSEPERVNLSAKTGRGVEKIFPAVERALTAYRFQIDTSELNRLVERAVAGHHAPTHAGKPWKVYYTTQVKTAPPTFILFANRTLPRGATYRRYLENFLRRELALPGVPIRLVIRKKT